MRMVDSIGGVHTSLVFSKTKVSPIKWLYLDCPCAHETTLLCQGDIPTTNRLCLRPDRQHHRVELVVWQPKEVQDLRGEQNFLHH